MKRDLRKISVKIHREQYEAIVALSSKSSKSMSEIVRVLIDGGLSERITEKNKTMMSQVVSEQMQLIIKPHVERLAALMSKSGHMSARATFLNVQALMDLVEPHRKRDVREMYESASKKAVEYMRIKTDDFESKKIFDK